MDVTRTQVLRYRCAVQGLAGQAPERAGIAALDLGVQDTGPDGAGWALAIRGGAEPTDELSLAWTLRGAPHAYRRREIAAVAAATAPWSDADAGKRIFDAAKPLRAAGIGILEALDVIAEAMAEIVTGPTVKGEVSSALTERLPAPYLRWCRPCQATHAYEQPFRLAALRAGLELEPDTSPPVLRPIPGWRGPATEVPDRLDPVRAVLHLLGPATPKQVAEYVDSPVREINRRWPEDTVEVKVDGERRHALASDSARLADPPTPTGVRLLGPYDLFLQGRDRTLLVPDEAARKDLWRVLGRPGAILEGAELVGTWRPRSSGRTLRLQATRWDGGALPSGLGEAAERLAAHRGRTFGGFV